MHRGSGIRRQDHTRPAALLKAAKGYVRLCKERGGRKPTWPGKWLERGEYRRYLPIPGPPTVAEIRAEEEARAAEARRFQEESRRTLDEMQRQSQADGLYKVEVGGDEAVEAVRQACDERRRAQAVFDRVRAA